MVQVNADENKQESKKPEVVIALEKCLENITVEFIDYMNELESDKADIERELHLIEMENDRLEKSIEEKIKEIEKLEQDNQVLVHRIIELDTENKYLKKELENKKES